MTKYLVLLLIFLPLIELTLLSQLITHSSITAALCLVLATGFVGVLLTRRQGTRAWQRIHQDIAAGRSPSAAIVNGVLILLAGAFLITPGLLTDTVGFALLLPPLRSFLGRQLAAWFRRHTVAVMQQSGSATGFGFPSKTDTPYEQAQRPSVRVVNPNEEQPEESPG